MFLKGDEKNEEERNVVLIRMHNFARGIRDNRLKRCNATPHYIRCYRM